MKEIELQDSIKIKIDQEDYERMRSWNWYLKQPKRNDRKTNKSTIKIHAEEKGKTIEFSQKLLGYDKEAFFVSYKNKDRLDFRKENLKLIPIKYLNHHTSCRTNSTSIYRGVYYDKRRNNYVASISIEKQKIYIGSYKTEEEAALKYNERAIKEFGEYACLNIFGENNSIQIIERSCKEKNEKKQKTKKEDELKEISLKCGISQRTLKSRMKKMSLEKAIELGKTKEKTKSPYGKSFTKLAEEYGVNRQTLSKYINKGFDLKNAIEAIYSQKNKRKTPIL